MACKRCGGLLVNDTHPSLDEAYWQLRCINCGELLDQTILDNRLFVALGPFGKRLREPPNDRMVKHPVVEK